jgi:hypothetical protein
VRKYIIGFFVFLQLILKFEEAFASCKVYGISDGPQSLSCDFGATKIELKCIKNKYYLNNRPVLIAFHLEVEDPKEVIPLVFKAEGMTLTAVLSNKKDKKSDLEVNGRNIFGNCSKI